MRNPLEWTRRGATPVVVLEMRDADVASLESEVMRLEERVVRLLALVRLLVVFVRTMDITPDDVRVPTATAKKRILDAVERAAAVLGRHAALRIVGLTDARLREWKKRELACALDDAAPCARTFPSRLTRDKRAAIRDLLEDDRYKHLPSARSRSSASASAASSRATPPGATSSASTAGVDRVCAFVRRS